LSDVLLIVLSTTEMKKAKHGGIKRNIGAVSLN
jgi:hypothetical protein